MRPAIAIRSCAVVLAGVLASCGGGGPDAGTSPFGSADGSGGGGGGSGGGGGNPTQSVAGLWIGTTNTGRAVTAIGLDPGTYYVLYSVAGNPAVIAGAVQGTGSTSGSTFASSNARDFNLEGLGVNSATVSATVSTRRAFAGTITYANSAVTFNSTYDNDFETTPTQAAIAGAYTGSVASSAGVQAASAVIGADGALTANSAGCAATGTVTARSDGNVYNLAITFGPAPCIFPGQSFSGIGYFDSTAQRFYGAAPNAARTDGVLFVGTKQ